MSTTAAPQIPPRPARSQHAAGTGSSKIPEIPPRPAHKQSDRSDSPTHYSHSPLYDAPSTYNLGRPISNDPSNLSLPARPPSVSLPSIGQEGNEYADIDYSSPTPGHAPEAEGVAQMRNIGGDLKLHAPKPSLPQASAKAQVKAVTRTDDQQAAAHGFGKAGTPIHEDIDPLGLSPGLKPPSVAHSSSQPSAPQSRRQSIAPGEDEQGSAELGLRVPINPNAGHVQAPSPAPLSAHPDHHVHSHHIHGKKRHHSRTKSGRDIYLPPGSYGLHGHGVHTHHKFDKDWYAKHPDLYLHEESIGHGHYSATGSGRGEWALSSEDLNKIVRETASRGAGFGTNEGIKSYPDEQIGYLASDQYSSRIASPAQGGGYLQKLHSNSSQPNIESPLRKTSFPADTLHKSEFDQSKGSVSGRSEALDSETEDDVVHVHDPARRYNKVTGGEETINETEDLGPDGGNTSEHSGHIDENGYGAPILASDEVAKDVGGEHLQAAVSPRQERRGSGFYLGDESTSGNITPMSRPTSRPASLHGFNNSLTRFLSRHEDGEELHTPLEDVEEYEPLFPDEDENKKRPIDAAERFKQRPGTLKHRFPSQDIWEDTPSSAMHVTMVSTPEPEVHNESSSTKVVSRTFEDPSVESARKGEVDEAEKSKLIPREERLAQSKFAPHLRDDMPTRPGMQQRFPSRDIWEDTPDSMHLVTTVTSPQPTGDDSRSPAEATSNKPSIPPRPANRSRLAESSTAPSVPISAEVKQPPVPARPTKRMHAVPPADAQSTNVTISPSNTLEKTISPTEGKKGPSLPDRPKPQVPARPMKKESLETLTKTLSAGSSGSQDAGIAPPLPKAKPTVPVRPVGNKSNLPTAFMSDLNQRLQLGPRPPVKEKDPELAVEKEALPLSDARKGRAKGPQRRAPAKSPSNSAEAGSTALPAFTVSPVRSLWSINEEDGLFVYVDEETLPLAQETLPNVLTEENDRKAANAAAATHAGDAPQALAPTGLALNTAGESADPDPFDSATATPGTEKSDPLSQSIGSLVRENREASSSLSKQTTASSGAISGVLLGRIASNNEQAGKRNSGRSDVQAVRHESLSTTTRATSAASGERLDKLSTRDPGIGADKEDSDNILPADEGAELIAPKPMPATSVETSSRLEKEEPQHVGTGHGEMRTESGMITNIPDRRLEEMTARADRKDHASEEQGISN